jgi:DNA-binding LytR/AlgR family response regulator
VNDRDRSPRRPYTGRVIRLFALLILIVVSGPAYARADVPLRTGPIRMCASPDQSRTCRPIELEEVRLRAPITTLAQTVTVDPAAMPLSRPLMVWVIALASSEVRWNGRLVGRNGVPAPSQAQEKPGRFVATFAIPREFVKPGPNLLTIRLSAHHLWFPVLRPVHDLHVGYYETPVLPGLSVYLPALLVLGALAAAALYFGAAAFLDRRDRGAPLLAAAAGCTIAQLLVETLRIFVAYDYPWHLLRVLAIAVFSAGTASFAAAYAARRFASIWQGRVPALTAAAGLLGILLVPSWDFKALAALLAGLIAILVCSLRGISAGLPGARTAAAAAALMIGLMLWELTLFLDQTYFLAAAALFLLLVAEQVLVLRNARRAREAEALRAAGLERSLDQARRSSGGPVVVLKDGARTHRVAPAEILFIKAADDYCEVRLRDGRTLLVTAALSRLHASLPENFARIHKSYVVNGDHVAQIATRPQGGRALVLTEGHSLPVGRTYGEVLARWTEPAPQGAALVTPSSSGC